MKKYAHLGLILTSVLAMALTGCGSGGGGNPPKHGTNYYLYVASESDTISAFSINPTNGALTSIPDSSVTTDNPSSVAADPSGKYLYVTNMISRSITIFSINATTGVLSQIQNIPFSTDSNPQKVIVDPTGNFVVVAFIYNKVTIFARDKVTGKLSDPSEIIVGSDKRPTAIAFDRTGDFVYIGVDNGTIFVYSKNLLTNNFVQIPGSPFSTCTNPSSITIGPDSNFLYALTTSSSQSVHIHPINQGSLDDAKPCNIGQSRSLIIDGNFLYLAKISSGVSVYSIAADGSFSYIDNFSLDDGMIPDLLTFDPLKNFLYVTGYDSSLILGFSRNLTDGKLTQITGSPFDNGTQISAIVTVKTLY